MMPGSVQVGFNQKSSVLLQPQQLLPNAANKRITNAQSNQVLTDAPSANNRRKTNFAEN